MDAIATSLTRAADHGPSLDELAILTLDALANAHRSMLAEGMSAAIDALNLRWADPVPVIVLLSDGDRISGRFTGLDRCGNLRLVDEFNRDFIVEHQRIERLLEIE